MRNLAFAVLFIVTHLQLFVFLQLFVSRSYNEILPGISQNFPGISQVAKFPRVRNFTTYEISQCENWLSQHCSSSPTCNSPFAYNSSFHAPTMKFCSEFSWNFQSCEIFATYEISQIVNFCNLRNLATSEFSQCEIGFRSTVHRHPPATLCFPATLYFTLLQ